MKKATQYNGKKNGLTTALLATIGLFSTLVMTGCNEKPVDKVIEQVTEESHTSAEHKAHAEHQHDESNHDKSKHNHADDHDHEHNHQDENGVKKDGVTHVGKHVHGEAELHAIIDSKQLILELNSPAMNIVGFEHQPNTDEQKEIIETQTQLLNDASKIFSVNGGSCTVADIDVDMPFKQVEEQHNHTANHADERIADKEYTHNHEQEEHVHEHNHKSDHEHNHEHNHEQQEGGEHSDVKATYHFTCQKTEDIKNISVNVFTTFTGFTKVNTKWINADKQGATSLTNDSYTIIFE